MSISASTRGTSTAGFPIKAAEDRVVASIAIVAAAAAATASTAAAAHAVVSATGVSGLGEGSHLALSILQHDSVVVIY